MSTQKNAEVIGVNQRTYQRQSASKPNEEKGNSTTKN